MKEDNTLEKQQIDDEKLESVTGGSLDKTKYTKHHYIIKLSCTYTYQKANFLNSLNGGNVSGVHSVNIIKGQLVVVYENEANIDIAEAEIKTKYITFQMQFDTECVFTRID